MAKSGQSWVPARTGRIPSGIWQAGVARLPLWLPRRDGEPRRAWIAVCASWETGALLPSNPGPEEEIPTLLKDVLSAAAREWRHDPLRVQVLEAAWVPALEEWLSPWGVEVETLSDLPLLRELLESLPHQMAEDDPRPGALAGTGVTVERMAALALAASGFMAASGWRHLNGEDLIRIEAPDAGEDLRFCVLTHVGGTSNPDLFFVSDPGHLVAGAGEAEEDYEEDLEDDPEDAWESQVSGAWLVKLLPPWEAPAGDVELWEQHGLPWIGKGSLPVALFAGREGILRPDRRQLAFFEGFFAALAATTESDLDTGRWEKEVETQEGPVRYVLSLPDLLAAKEAAQPSRAEDLLVFALRARGRQVSLLARQTLEVWPDCADAYCILASRALELESAALLFEQGMAAGERAMGPEAFEDAGYFWGLIETRPYMRAREGLAHTRIKQGRLAEAVDHHQEMLRLNPGDNQGMRFSLVNLLIALDRDEEAWKWLDHFSEDDQALMEFPRALLRFRGEGDSLAARKTLKQAIKANRFVAGMLLGKRPVPPGGGFYSPGEESEAGVYLEFSAGTWNTTAGALDWLRRRTASPPRTAKRGKAKPKKARR